MPTPTTFEVRINATDKSIEVRKNTFTVNQIYSFLMDQFDEQGYMDDLIPMNAKTPTLYELVNGWTFTPLSNDFMTSSAITETRNGTTDFNIWTNVRSLGAIESGSTLYIQQGTVVTYDAFYPFCSSLPLGTEGTEYGTLVVSGTIPASVPSSGSLRIGVGEAVDEVIGYSSWVQPVGSTRGTFILSTTPANSHPVSWPNTYPIVEVPMTGHFDMLLKTREDGGNISGTTFSTYCRQFQKSYSAFITTGGAVVSNVPLSSASDPFLTVAGAQCVAWENTVTLEWTADNVKRSAFDGTTDVQEYILDQSVNDSDGTIITSTTIDFSVPASGWLQIEEEVIYYSSYETGFEKGSFIVAEAGRGTMDTAAASHLAGKGVSTAMFEYNILVQMSTRLSLLNVYNFIQYELLQKYNINDGAGDWRIGRLTDPLASYTGMLWTNAGVWAESFATSDASNIRYRDVNNLLHTPPTYITLLIDGDSAMENGRGAMYRLNAPYNPTAYTIVATYIDAVLDADGNASTVIKFEDTYYVLVRTRKAGRLPFETGAQIAATGLTVLASNPEDTIYT